MTRVFDTSCRFVRHGHSDFVAATRIVVKFFEAGADSVPKLSILLRRVSFAVAEARKEVSQQNNRRKSSKNRLSLEF